MAIRAWDEVRTAYQVARVGTVSGAAEALGVHHATVIRHIDAIEAELGARLFQRHPRGYTPTEAGRDLLQVAQATDDQFTQLAGRIKGQGEGVTGEITVTSLPSFSALLAPVLASFRAAYPAISVRLLTGERLFRLEYGEAHVAIRAGQAPQEPDNVVQPFVVERFALYASEAYVVRMGMPQTDADLVTHEFVNHDNVGTKAPFYRWLNDAVPPERIVFRATEPGVLRDAIEAGIGIGFLSELRAGRREDLVRVVAPRPEWEAQHWLVTHVDLHRSPKVQAILAHLKEAAAGWAAGPERKSAAAGR